MSHIIRPTAVILTLCLALLAAGCASHSVKQPQPESRPLSGRAQLSYEYLVYQDYLQQLQKLRSGREVPLSPEEKAALISNAESALNRLIADAPTPEFYLEKAGLYWGDKDGLSHSRQVLKEGLKTFPDNRVLTVYLANSYVVENRTDDAIAIMNDYLSRHQDDIQVREKLGQMLMDAGMDTQALDVLNAIPADKRSADALYTMGRVQGNLGMRKLAIPNLRKAVEMDPGFTEAMVELAYQYELNKDYVTAEKTYAAILEQGEPFPEARLRIIGINLKLNNPSRALQYTLNGEPTKSFIMEAALLFIENGFYAQGSTVLDMLTQNGETPAEYYFYKAVIANEGENDPAKALDQLTNVKESDRLYPHALRFRAQLYYAMGKPDKALILARQGKERYPASSLFYILEATLLRNRNDLKDAESVLLDGLDHIQGDPDITYELAMIYEMLGRREEGLARMETVVRAHPDNSSALNYVGYTLAEENRDLDRALVLVQKASSLDPENGAILDSVAWVHFKRGELDKAWENIRYAVEIIDNDPTVWEHYGDIAKALGRTSDARKGYKRALKLGGPNDDAIKQKLKNL